MTREGHGDLRAEHVVLEPQLCIVDRVELTSAGARDFRLPELFCGVDRYESRAIVAYPVACIPQAWAAAAPFMLLQALLGISAHAPENRLTVDQPISRTGFHGWMSETFASGPQS